MVCNAERLLSQFPKGTASRAAAKYDRLRNVSLALAAMKTKHVPLHIMLLSHAPSDLESLPESNQSVYQCQIIPVRLFCAVATCIVDAIQYGLNLRFPNKMPQRQGFLERQLDPCYQAVLLRKYGMPCTTSWEAIEAERRVQRLHNLQSGLLSMRPTGSGKVVTEVAKLTKQVNSKRFASRLFGDSLDEQSGLLGRSACRR